MKYVVYIIQSLSDNTYYIGYSSNIEKRLEEHNKGLSRFTSKKIPWKLVYTECFVTKTEALQREKFLKRQKNRSFYESLISGYNKTVR